MRGGADYCPPAALYAIGAGRESHSASEGSAMHIDPKEGSPAMDYTEHAKTYKLFCKLTAFAIVGVVVVMALLAVFVA
jgi:hypothetical protein